MAEYVVETREGIELKRGFKTLDAARKYAYKTKGDVFEGGVVMSLTSKGKRPVGMISFPGMFLSEYRWTPYKNPKNTKYILNKDGTVRRK